MCSGRCRPAMSSRLAERARAQLLLVAAPPPLRGRLGRGSRSERAALPRRSDHLPRPPPRPSPQGGGSSFDIVPVMTNLDALRQGMVGEGPRAGWRETIGARVAEVDAGRV